ncbi:MAG: carbon monoxide dehydrogenase subunit G [Woeseia sp.]
MDVKGEYRIRAPREQVWVALNDPEMLAKCIPGCEVLERVTDSELKGRIRAAIGPVRATFNTRITLENLNPPASYTLAGESKAGGAGFGKGSADVTLEPVDDGTLLSYNARFKVGGKLAQIGSRLVAGATEKTADEFFGNLSRELDSGAGGVSDDSTPGPGTGQSGVGKRMVAIAGAVVAVAVLLVMWLLLRE